jgi:hypothetical protein
VHCFSFPSASTLIVCTVFFSTIITLGSVYCISLTPSTLFTPGKCALYFSPLPLHQESVFCICLHFLFTWTVCSVFLYALLTPAKCVLYSSPLLLTTGKCSQFCRMKCLRYGLNKCLNTTCWTKARFMV